MAQVFAYLNHKNGVLEDAAMELINAAKAISSEPATAIVCGSGIDAVATAAAAIFPKVIKVDNAALDYPNAEVVRKALVNVIPAGSVVLFAHKDFDDMDRKERVRACYQHACLLYVSNQRMTNQSLRNRFSLPESKAEAISRIISDAVSDDKIKLDDPENRSRRYAKYIPFWG